MGTIKLDKKKVELLSENVNPLIINLLETTIQSIYENASPEAKPSIEEAFGEEKPESIQDRVKTFEDACLFNEMSSKNIPEPEVYSVSSDAFYRLVIIARALNGWPYGVKPGDSLWYPYFLNGNDFNFGYAGVRERQTYCMPISLCCNTKEKAEYFGKQFIDIWEKYLLY